MGPISHAERAERLDYGQSLGSLPGTMRWHEIDVATSLRSWQADPTSNHGWIWLPGGANGVEIASCGKHSRLTAGAARWRAQRAGRRQLHPPRDDFGNSGDCGYATILELVDNRPSTTRQPAGSPARGKAIRRCSRSATASGYAASPRGCGYFVWEEGPHGVMVRCFLKQLRAGGVQRVCTVDALRLWRRQWQLPRPGHVCGAIGCRPGACTAARAAAAQYGDREQDHLRSSARRRERGQGDGCYASPSRYEMVRVNGYDGVQTYGFCFR